VPVVVKPGASLPAVPPPLSAPAQALHHREPPSYNRIGIDYTKNVNESELSEVASQVRLALELRRRFIWKPTRDTTRYDLREAPRFHMPIERVPQKTHHQWTIVDGVAIAWEPNPAAADEAAKKKAAVSPPAVGSPTAAAATSESKQATPGNSAAAASSPTGAAAPAPAAGATPAADEKDDPLSLSRALTVFDCPSRTDFIAALAFLEDFCAAGPMKSFTYNRLHVLEARFNLHELLNSDIEALSQKTVPHRDFYNVRKIDNHVHHSACTHAVPSERRAPRPRPYPRAGLCAHVSVAYVHSLCVI
jgi:hypothetical protein